MFSEFSNVFNFRILKLNWNMERQLERLESIDESLKSIDEKASIKRELEAEETLKMGISLMQKGAIADSIQILNEGLRLNPNDCRIYIVLGNAYLKKKELSVALEMFEKALLIANTNYFKSYSLLSASQVYHLLNCPYEAVKCSQESTKLSPNFPEFYYYYSTYLAQICPKTGVNSRSNSDTYFEQEMFDALKKAIKGDKNYFVLAENDSMFSEVRPQISKLLDNIYTQLKKDLEIQLSSIEKDLKKLKKWVDMRYASNDDIMTFESVNDKVKNIKDLKFNGCYFDLVYASAISSQSKKEIEDLQKLIRAQLDNLRYQKSNKNNKLHETSIQIESEMKRKKMTSIKVSLILLIICFLLIQSIILHFIYLYTLCFFLLIIINLFLSHMSQFYNIKGFENPFWMVVYKKYISISLESEAYRISLKDYKLNITILITNSYLVTYYLFSISLFYDLFTNGMEMGAVILFIIYTGLPTFPLLGNTYLSDRKTEKENIIREIDVLTEKISVCENSL